MMLDQLQPNKLLEEAILNNQLWSQREQIVKHEKAYVTLLINSKDYLLVLMVLTPQVMKEESRRLHSGI
jgi:hypothetical protein